MRAFIPSQNHLSVLDEVGRWKVTSLKRLVENFSGSSSYRSIARYVSDLEKNALLKSFRGKQGTKNLYLSTKGSAFVGYPSLYDKYSNELTHDYLTSLVLQSALEFENFKSSKAIYNDESNIIPDGLIFATKNEKEYILAIEIELTAKKKTRVINRFRKYLDSKEYPHALFLFNKDSVFKTYIEVLKGVQSEGTRRIILGYDQNISKGKLNTNCENYFFNNELTSFDKIFVGKEMATVGKLSSTLPKYSPNYR